MRKRRVTYAAPAQAVVVVSTLPCRHAPQHLTLLHIDSQKYRSAELARGNENHRHWSSTAG